MIEIKLCCRCNDEHKNMFESNRKRHSNSVDCEYTCSTCKKTVIVRLSYDGDIEQYREESIPKHLGRSVSGLGKMIGLTEKQKQQIQDEQFKEDSN